MDTKDQSDIIRRLLDAGIRLGEAKISVLDGLTVKTTDCESYRAACELLNAKPDGGRLLPNPHRRMHDALTKDGVTIEHLCWPHLDCWEAK